MTDQLVFLDVDGVLNAGQRHPEGGWGMTDVHVGHERYTIRYNPNHGAQLLALAEETGAQLVWATTWQDLANEFISPLVGLPTNLPVVVMDPEFGFGSVPLVHPKTPMVAQYAQGRDFVWFDDDLSRMDRKYLEGHENVGAFRLIHTSFRSGLNDKQIEQARQWLLVRREAEKSCRGAL